MIYRNALELEKIVTKKCATQNFNTDDPKGIIFHKDSSLAKSIVKSPEFKNIIWKHYEDLLVNNKIIDETSISMEWDYMSPINFDISINNFASIHKSYIFDIFIKNGIVHAIIFDTEDYNDPKELAPYMLQKANIIKNYYFMVEIETPLNKIFPNDEENLF